MSDLAAFLADALSRDPDASSSGSVVVLPAPPLDPLRILRTSRKGEAWLLERGDETLLGLGTAAARELGAEPSSLVDRHHALAERWRVSAHPDADAALAARAPITFFGAAFAEGAGDEEPWLDHRDGRVAVPRWTYLRRGDRAVLALASAEPVTPARRALAVAELAALLGPHEPTSLFHRGSGRVRRDAESPIAHRARIGAAQEAIGAGTLDKVVCARRVSASAEHDLNAEDAYARLPASSLRFLVRVGRASLLGASPEHLFVKRGERVSSEALAGTRTDDADAQLLLASSKDLSEHAPVVRAIEAALTGLGAEVRIDPAPRLERAANVVHLRTAIEATLPTGVTAGQLLAALHPTPALGGSPREAAVAFIRAHEPPRGWYGGPIGTIDRGGDAEVHVALRCGVLRGARAWLFAGGGIVRSSDARAEFEETELKLQPMLAALAVEASPPPVEASRPVATLPPSSAAPARSEARLEATP